MRTARIDRPSGFTLVELLIVIGVIALLIGLLLPALASARRQAQMIACSAQLHSLGQSLLLHANEHRGFWPLAGQVRPNVGGTDVGAAPQYLQDVSRQRYTYVDNNGDGVYIRPAGMAISLSPYIGAPQINTSGYNNFNPPQERRGPYVDPFLCPSDVDTATLDYSANCWSWCNTPSFMGVYGYTSYGFNENVFGWCDKGVGGVTGPSRLRGNSAQVTDPAHTLLCADQSIWKTAAVANTFYCTGPSVSLKKIYDVSTSQTPSFDLTRHKGKINILFADYHVESLPILSTGLDHATGAIGTALNSGSNDLAQIMMN